MSKKWNEMTKSEQNHAILDLALGLISLVFVVLDICKVWEYAHLGWCISFGLYLGIDAKEHWNKSRKIAIVELVCAVLLIGFNVVTMFM